MVKWLTFYFNNNYDILESELRIRLRLYQNTDKSHSEYHIKIEKMKLKRNFKTVKTLKLAQTTSCLSVHLLGYMRPLPDR